MNKNTKNSLVDTPDVLVKAELAKYVPANEDTNAIDDFCIKIREAIAVSPADWPKGRTLELTLKFALVPITLNAKFGQK